MCVCVCVFAHMHTASDGCTEGMRGGFAANGCCGNLWVITGVGVGVCCLIIELIQSLRVKRSVLMCNVVSMCRCVSVCT